MIRTIKRAFSRNCRVGVWVVAAGLLLAACTTVPRSSAPQVIKSFGVAQQPVVPAPPAGADARAIVQGFLDANAISDLNHNSARLFLTAEEKNRWADSPITVIDRPVVSNVVGGKVTVVGHEIGTVDATGVYTPALQGDGAGTGGVRVNLPFGMKRVKGEWRIDALQKGLLISTAQFQQYQQRTVYFFDPSEERLVPDPRYSQLVDPHDLAVWLVAQLSQGPRGGLATGLPDQTDPKRVPFDNNQSGDTKIEIPGSAELDSGNRDRLGAQIAATLSQVPQIGDIEITDSGVPVRIPAVGGTTFTAAELADQFTVSPPHSGLYYVNDGAVFDQFGRRLPGRVGTGTYGLTSVALTPRTGSQVLEIAGVRGSGSDEFLDVGTAQQLTATKVHGELSRPAWAPDQNEIWIGSGTHLDRVSLSGAIHDVPIDAVGGKPSGRVSAVRLSPEGARVALVLTNPDGTAQLWVGAIVRGATEVRVAGLAPITPQGVKVTDLAWNDELKLFTIGTDLRTHAFGVYEVQCDGSLWTLRGTLGLPGAPDSVTVAANSVAAVSIGGTVWRQQAGSWEGLHGDETHGTNPVYVE
jgi:hypothetical protein